MRPPPFFVCSVFVSYSVSDIRSFLSFILSVRLLQPVHAPKEPQTRLRTEDRFRKLLHVMLHELRALSRHCDEVRLQQDLVVDPVRHEIRMMVSDQIDDSCQLL